MIWFPSLNPFTLLASSDLHSFKMRAFELKMHCPSISQTTKYASLLERSRLAISLCEGNVVSLGKSAVSEINGSEDSSSELTMQYATIIGPCGVLTKFGLRTQEAESFLTIVVENSSSVDLTKNAQVIIPSSPWTIEGNVPLN